MQWFNEPPWWEDASGALTFTTGAETDFWQSTHYGFQHDNGHIRGETVSGDFTAETVFSADYQAQYDQAGLMLRASATEWVKAGVEFAHGTFALSVVVTRGLSDWSVTPVAAGAPVHLRMTRRADALCVEAAPAGAPLRMLRLAAITKEPGLVGAMACSPTRAGLRARFEGLRFSEAIDFSSVA